MASKKSGIKRTVKLNRRMRSTSPMKLEHEKLPLSQMTYGTVLSQNPVKVYVTDNIKISRRHIEERTSEFDVKNGWYEVIGTIAMQMRGECDNWEVEMANHKMVGTGLSISKVYGIIDGTENHSYQIGNTGYYINTAGSPGAILQFLIGYCEWLDIEYDKLKFDTRFREGYKEVKRSTDVVDSLASKDFSQLEKSEKIQLNDMREKERSKR